MRSLFKADFPSMFSTLSKKQLLYLGGGFVLFIVYLFLRSNSSGTETKIIKTGGFDLKSSRVLGQPLDHMLQGKTQKIYEREKKLIESNKMLLSKIDGLEKRMNDLSKDRSLHGYESEKANEGQAASSQPQSELSKQESNFIPDKEKVRFEENGSGFSISNVVSNSSDRNRTLSSNQNFSSQPSSRKEFKRLSPQIISFPVKTTPKKGTKEPGIPAGAYVKGVVLTGVDAHQAEWPVLIQLEFAFIGPNETKIDLSGCFVIAKAKGDLSIERAIMQTEKISCVAQNGDMFESNINGWVNDDTDNRFGVKGPVQSKRGRVLTTAFLASVVEGVGKAIQLGESTQMTNAVGGAQSVITGDQGRFITGGAAATAASRVADWYLRQAENLLPSITVGSGKSVWIAVKDKVDVPTKYFEPEILQQRGGHGSEKPYLSYIN